MGYRMMGVLHARATRIARGRRARLASERVMTVEYVALIRSWRSCWPRGHGHSGQNSARRDRGGDRHSSRASRGQLTPASHACSARTGPPRFGRGQPRLARPSAGASPDPFSLASPERSLVVFDWASAGLTVPAQRLVSLPPEDFLYLGDTARICPYGSFHRGRLEFAVQIADHLLAAGATDRRCRCNSATSRRLPALEEHLAADARAAVLSRRVPDRTSRRETTHPVGSACRHSTTVAPAAAYDGRAHGRPARPTSRAPVSRSCPDHHVGFPFDQRVVDPSTVLRAAARGGGLTP